MVLVITNTFFGLLKQLTNKAITSPKHRAHKWINTSCIRQYLHTTSYFILCEILWYLEKSRAIDLDRSVDYKIRITNVEKLKLWAGTKKFMGPEQKIYRLETIYQIK